MTQPTKAEAIRLSLIERVINEKGTESSKRTLGDIVSLALDLACQKLAGEGEWADEKLQEHVNAGEADDKIIDEIERDKAEQRDELRDERV